MSLDTSPPTPPRLSTFNSPTILIGILGTSRIERVASPRGLRRESPDANKLPWRHVGNCCAWSPYFRAEPAAIAPFLAILKRRIHRKRVRGNIWTDGAATCRRAGAHRQWCARNVPEYMECKTRSQLFPNRYLFPFRLPLLRQLLRLGDLGRSHLIGERITK